MGIYLSYIRGINMNKIIIMTYTLILPMVVFAESTYHSDGSSSYTIK